VKKLIIAIDGPSGAGKSTLSKALADSLHYTNIDTGAMFRAVALQTMRQSIDLNDEQQIEAMCRSIDIRFDRSGTEERILLNGEDVSAAIRTPDVSLLTAQVAALPVVRKTLLNLQRQMGENGGVVLEGRDIGSVVFPDAEVKFFLSATAQQRGKRRYLELKAKGIEVDLDQTIAEVEARDLADSSRQHAPLLRAADAIDIDSTSMSISEVLSKMLGIINRRMIPGTER